MYISRGHYPPNNKESNGKHDGKLNGLTAERPAESLLASSDKNEVPDFWL